MLLTNIRQRIEIDQGNNRHNKHIHNYIPTCIEDAVWIQLNLFQKEKLHHFGGRGVQQISVNNLGEDFFFFFFWL